MIDSLNLSVITQNLPYLLDGLSVTLIVTLVATIGSFALGILLAIARRSTLSVPRYLAAAYIDLMRVVPLLMVIFWIYFLVPILTGRPTSGLFSVCLALMLYNASYMAEIIRSGMDSVPKGLLDAGRSSGLSLLASYRYLLLPLAIGNTLPALITRLISIIMGSSLSYVVAVPDFFRVAYNVNSRTFAPYEIYGFIALSYFLMCYGLSMVCSYFERRRRVYIY